MTAPTQRPASTFPPRTAPYEERFWARVDRRSDSECWPWLGHARALAAEAKRHGKWLHMGRVKTHCQICGAFVRVDPSQRDGRLCSARCRAEAKSAQRRARKGAAC